MKRAWVTSSFDDFDTPATPTVAPSTIKSWARTCSTSPNAKISVKHNKLSTSITSSYTSLVKSKSSHELWCDESVTREQLAVHKKKVQEVEAWLLAAFTQTKGHRVLLLTGPAGCGKTACVRALVREMGLTVKEWINATNQPWVQDGEWLSGDSVPEQSQAQQFQEFVLRVNRYGSVVTSHATPSILLVEDVPNVFYRDPTQFHNIVKRYAACSGAPGIFVMSDSPQLEHSARHLFPPSLQSSLSLTTIQFNPVAVTLIQKALKEVANRRNLDVDSAALGEMATQAQGDIRTAINALQFTADGTTDIGLSTRGSIKKPGRKRGAAAGKGANKSSTRGLSVTGKDTSLLMFRALGKVLYSKRQDAPPLPLPAHLSHEERRPALEVAEDVMDRSCLTPASFLSFLHHNWTPFMTDSTNANTALKYLTDADILMAHWTDTNVLCRYSSIASRGVMHASGGGNKATSFLALTSPAGTEVIKTAAARTTALRDAYPARALHPLTSEILPYAAKICAGRLDSYDSRLVQEIGSWSSGGGDGRPLAASVTESCIDARETLDYDSDISDVPD